MTIFHAAEVRSVYKLIQDGYYANAHPNTVIEYLQPYWYLFGNTGCLGSALFRYASASENNDNDFMSQ